MKPLETIATAVVFILVVIAIVTAVVTHKPVGTIIKESVCEMVKAEALKDPEDCND